MVYEGAVCVECVVVCGGVVWYAGVCWCVYNVWLCVLCYGVHVYVCCVCVCCSLMVSHMSDNPLPQNCIASPKTPFLVPYIFF